MRHGPSVWNRTGRLEVRVQETTVHEAVARVAAAMDVDPVELLAEVEALLERAWAMGARTDAEIAAVVARERGMTEAELRTEVARLTAGTGSSVP